MFGVIQDLWLCISRPSTFLFDFRFYSKITPIYSNSVDICSSTLSALYLLVKIPLGFDQFDSFFCVPSMGGPFINYTTMYYVIPTVLGYAFFIIIFVFFIIICWGRHFQPSHRVLMALGFQMNK